MLFLVTSFYGETTSVEFFIPSVVIAVVSSTTPFVVYKTFPLIERIVDFLKVLYQSSTLWQELLELQLTTQLRNDLPSSSRTKSLFNVLHLFDKLVSNTLANGDVVKKSSIFFIGETK